MATRGSTQVITLCQVGDHQTLDFATAELSKYLGRMLGQDMQITIRKQAQYDPQAKGALWLGLNSAFGVAKAVADPELDDTVYLDVRAAEGIIAGSNPRSVLLATYRLLTEAGCRWLRPGTSGEWIPQKALDDFTARVDEKAAYRHRGLCIEGAVSYQNVAEIVDWSPKVGLNAYFTQFRESYTFFERWYTHRGNPTQFAEPFPAEHAREFIAGLTREIKRRGMLYHAVGHGWTCEPFGLPGLGWDAQTYDVPADVIQYLAEVDGKRALWGGIPLNTNLCYSNAKVRGTMVDAIGDYLEQHEDIDVLHFWLADGANNQCECENCRKMIPSDFYVLMLNALDELLTQRGIKTKIVFLIYVDLLWPPEVERIKNPDRFILMFAPITRTYSKEFTVSDAEITLPPYDRNKLKFPANVDENVAFLRAWQRMFKGDSFDFDYHYMWDHYNDPGYYAVARLLGLDVTHMKEIGLNGLISCQVQRAFFPTGLGMYVMGRTLWDDRLGFDGIATDYFDSSFGSDGTGARGYLAKLSDLFDPPYLRGEKPAVSAESAKRFAQVPAVVDAFRPTIAKNLSLPDQCQALSWLYLKHHAEMCVLFARLLEARARDDRDRVNGLWRQLVEYVQRNEDAIQPVFDVFEFIATMERKVNR